MIIYRMLSEYCISRCPRNVYLESNTLHCFHGLVAILLVCMLQPNRCKCVYSITTSELLKVWKGFSVFSWLGWKKNRKNHKNFYLGYALHSRNKRLRICIKSSYIHKCMVKTSSFFLQLGLITLTTITAEMFKIS